MFFLIQAHKVAYLDINKLNKKRVLNKNGEYVPTMPFKEAFTHHVDYMWCRAKGIFGAKLGLRPEFKQYIRGAPTACSQPCTTP